MTEIHRLQYVTGGTTPIENASLIFGHMVRLALPVMQGYYSDLYHDGMWLRESLESVKGNNYTFYWSVDQSGTTIGHTAIAMRENKFRLTVVCGDSGKSTLEITEL